MLVNYVKVTVTAEEKIKITDNFRKHSFTICVQKGGSVKGYSVLFFLSFVVFFVLFWFFFEKCECQTPRRIFCLAQNDGATILEETDLTFKVVVFLIERFGVKFTINVDFVPLDQVFLHMSLTAYYFYTEMSSFTPLLSIRSVLDSFLSPHFLF